MKAAGLAIILLAIAVSVSAMPFSARACLTSTRSEPGCGCCVKKVCCMSSNQKQTPVTQPLATTAGGHELSLNVGAGGAVIGYEFPRVRATSQFASHEQGGSPPMRVLLCTFLI